MTKEISLSLPQVQQMFEAEKAKLQNLDRNMTQMHAALREISTAKDFLKTLKEGKDDEIMVAVGGGIFFDAKIADRKKVKISLPGSVVKPVTVEEALKKMEEQEKALEKNIEEMRKNGEKLAANINNLGKALNMALKVEQEARAKQQG